MTGNDERSNQSRDRPNRADEEPGRRINWLALGGRAIVLVAAVLTILSMFRATEAVAAIQDGVVTIILVQSMLMLQLAPGRDRESDRASRLDRLERRLERLERNETAPPSSPPQPRSPSR